MYHFEEASQKTRAFQTPISTILQTYCHWGPVDVMLPFKICLKSVQTKGQLPALGLPHVVIDLWRSRKRGHDLRDDPWRGDPWSPTDPGDEIGKHQIIAIPL